MGKIVFTLNKTLEEFNLSRNKVAVESKIRPMAVGEMFKGKSKAIRIDTLERILETLNRLGNRPVTIEDVMVYKEDVNGND